MKKIISRMLSFLITSSLVIGCSNTKEDNSDKSETTQKSTEKVKKVLDNGLRIVYII